MVTLAAADVEVGPASKRSGIIFNESAVVDERGDVLDGLLNEDAQPSSTTEVDVVVESKVDLFAGVFRRKKGTVVHELTVSNVDHWLGVNGHSCLVALSVVGNGDGSRVTSKLSLGYVSLATGEVGSVDVHQLYVEKIQC